MYNHSCLLLQYYSREKKNMKILFFINRLYGGGAERVASILLNHFSKKHDTYVAVTDLKGPTYHINNLVHLINNQIQIKVKGAGRIPGFVKMIQLINEIKPDMIISFLTRTNNNAIFANLFFQKKIIVSERNTLNRVSSKTQKYLRKLLYPHTSKIVFVTTEDLKSFKLPQKSITIYNPAIFEPYSNYENRGKSIITIAPTDRWYNKGLDILVSVWGRIAPQYHDWNLEIYGKYNESDLPDTITQHNERISWKGWNHNIAEVLRTKSIFILASRFEGCPNSLIEAMSQGCACIGTDCEGGIKEIITDGIDGVIAKNDDVDDIANKLQMLIDDETLRRKLSAGAIEKVKQFDKNAFFAKWDNLLEEVAGK